MDFKNYLDYRNSLVGGKIVDNEETIVDPLYNETL